MKNLEQIRAATALAYAEAGVNTRGSKGGEIVKKLPALIMSNGLLAARRFRISPLQPRTTLRAEGVNLKVLAAGGWGGAAQ
jgi:CRISPR/Cas system CMR-associated protein Cmr5 small subunit